MRTERTTRRREQVLQRTRVVAEDRPLADAKPPAAAFEMNDVPLRQPRRALFDGVAPGLDAKVRMGAAQRLEKGVSARLQVAARD